MCARTNMWVCSKLDPGYKTTHGMKANGRWCSETHKADSITVWQCARSFQLYANYKKIKRAHFSEHNNPSKYLCREKSWCTSTGHYIIDKLLQEQESFCIIHTSVVCRHLKHIKFLLSKVMFTFTPTYLTSEWKNESPVFLPLLLPQWKMQAEALGIPRLPLLPTRVKPAEHTNNNTQLSQLLKDKRLCVYMSQPLIHVT